MSVLRVLAGLARRLHTRHKFAALGALGMLMVATPWVGVLREQAREIESILGAQAAFDPIARAVDVQRALLAHRLPAGRVLRGQAAAEPERLERQREADRRIDELGSVLQRGRLVPALDEQVALRSDWVDLLARIAARSVAAEGSNVAHQLLVEQALQIIDLVGDALAVGPASDEADAGRRLALRTLPQLEVAVVALESARLDADPAARLAALARLQGRAAQLQRVVAPAPVAGSGPGAVDTNAARRHQARLAAGEALAAYTAAASRAVSHATSAERSAIEQQADATLVALHRWADAERASLAGSIAATLARQREARRSTQLALGASLAVWLLALAWLWPRRPAVAGAAAMGADGSRHAGGESAPAARHLLRRLQQPAPDTETPTHY